MLITYDDDEPKPPKPYQQLQLTPAVLDPIQNPQPSFLDSNNPNISGTQLNLGSIPDIDNGIKYLLQGQYQSSNYVKGLVGWSINSDGSAEFRDVLLDNLTIENSVTFSFPTIQDYILNAFNRTGTLGLRPETLSLQSQTSGKPFIFSFSTEDQDGTDNTLLNLYGVGGPETDISGSTSAISKYLSVGYNSGVFQIVSNTTSDSGLTGLDLWIGTAGGTFGPDNSNQLILKSDGNVYAKNALLVADEAYGAGWDGSLQVPTKNAVYDKIQTLSSGGFSYGCKAQRITSTQSIPASTTTKIQLNSEDWDLAGEYDPTTNYRYTATTAGYYQVTFSVGFVTTENTKRYAGFVIINGGVGIAQVENHASGTDEMAITGAGMVHLAIGDYLELFVYHNSVAAKNIYLGGNSVYMTIQRIL